LSRAVCIAPGRQLHDAVHPATTPRLAVSAFAPEESLTLLASEGGLSLCKRGRGFVTLTCTDLVVVAHETGWKLELDMESEVSTLS
jgi:hypothetical protein